MERNASTGENVSEQKRNERSGEEGRELKKNQTHEKNYAKSKVTSQTNSHDDKDTEDHLHHSKTTRQ